MATPEQMDNEMVGASHDLDEILKDETLEAGIKATANWVREWNGKCGLKRLGRILREVE